MSVFSFLLFNYLTLIPFQVGFITNEPNPTIRAYSQYTHSNGINNLRYFTLPKNLDAKNNNKKSKISFVRTKIAKYGVIGWFLINDTTKTKKIRLEQSTIKPNERLMKFELYFAL